MAQPIPPVRILLFLPVLLAHTVVVSGSVWLLRDVTLASASGPLDPGSAVVGRPEDPQFPGRVPNNLDEYGESYDDASKYEKISFATLSGFECDTLPQQAGSASAVDIPSDVRALTGKAISLHGFMVPVDVSAKGLVRRFILTESQSLCCFGVAPAANEWVQVDMDDLTGTRLRVDQPIEVLGTLRVSEYADEPYVKALYTITAKTVRPAPRGLRGARLGP